MMVAAVQDVRNFVVLLRMAAAKDAYPVQDADVCGKNHGSAADMWKSGSVVISGLLDEP